MDRTVVLRFDARVPVVIGALLVLVAAWLPWTNLPSFVGGDLARRGMDGGGLITFGLALLVLLSLLLPWHPLRRVSLAATILAVFTDLVVLIAFARVMRLSGSLGIALGAQLGSVGSGIYLTFAGAALMLFGGLADATPPSLFEPQFSHLVSPWQIEIALRVALAGLLLASCLCAWGIGLLMRPYALVNPDQAAATFRPAPTTFLATPLVDVHLAPLSTVRGGESGTAITSTRPGIALPATPTPAPVSAASSTSPTPRTAQPLAPPTPTVLIEPTQTLPTIGAPTASASATGTPTTSASATSTPTQTPPVSPLGTPTASATTAP
jgi:hypothetical protein